MDTKIALICDVVIFQVFKNQEVEKFLKTAKMFSSWWSKSSTAFSCDLGQEVNLNNRTLGAGAFGQINEGIHKATNNKVSIFVCSDTESSTFTAASSAVKKLKTLRHPSGKN